MSNPASPFDFPCGRTRRQFLWQAGNGFFGTAMAWMLGFMLIGFTVHQLKVLSRVEFRANTAKDS